MTESRWLWAASLRLYGRTDALDALCDADPEEWRRVVALEIASAQDVEEAHRRRERGR